jgi:hypothetical protein
MLQTISSHFQSAASIRAYKILFASSLTWLALELAFPSLVSDGFVPVVMVGMDALLLGIAIGDLRTRRVPNLVTYPLMLAGIVRALWVHDPVFLLYWGALWLLWTARFIGGGDAKLLMGLFGLFPDMRMTWLVAASVFVTGVPYLVYKHRHALTNVSGWGSALRVLGMRLITLQLLPSPSEFDREAVPFAFSFCLAGAVYLWLRGG